MKQLLMLGTDYDSLLLAVYEYPTDHAAKAILADWLTDNLVSPDHHLHGRSQFSMIDALRYAASHGKHPFKKGYRYCWTKEKSSLSQRKSWYAATLPSYLFSAMYQGTRNMVSWDKFDMAFIDLGLAIQEIRSDLAIATVLATHKTIPASKPLIKIGKPLIEILSKKSS